MAFLFLPSTPTVATAGGNSSRLSVIDVLRGFALFGMILTHSFNLFWHEIRMDYGDGFGLSPLDSFFDIGADVFLVRKFFTIFSFLFGLGFAMQFQSAKAKGVPIIGRFIWRLLILLLIGSIMNLTINAGKILQIYALLGLVLHFSHTWKAKTLLFFSLSLFGINLVINHFSPSLNALTSIFLAPLTGAQIGESGMVSPLLYGGLNWFFGELLSGRLLMETSLFLFGQYVGRKNVFTNSMENQLIHKKTAQWGGGIALLSTLAIASVKLSGITQNPAYYQLLNFDLVVAYLKLIQQTSMSFFYIAILVQLYRLGFLKRLLSWLEPAGKMALTTFIIQAIFLLFFQKLALAHSLGLAGTMGIGFMFFALQLVLARLWMSHYRQGPVEWIWRTITYLKWQPVRKKPPQILTTNS